MSKYNFIPTRSPEVAKNYNGFIGPNGEFFMVSQRRSHDPTHIEWATNYIAGYTNYVKLLANLNDSLLYTLSRLKDKQDMLIHYYGFVYYGHDQYTNLPIVIYPDKDINDKEITIEQRRMLYDVMSANKETEHYKFEHQKYEDDAKLNDYIDRFIAKQIEKGIK